MMAERVGGMATIKDVAALANVSIATVSHHLNKTKAVSKPTAERVARAIVALGYQKDDLAAWFKTAEVPVVFLAAPHADTSFFDDVAAAIEDRFAARGLSVLRVQIATLERMRRGGALGLLPATRCRRCRARPFGRMDRRRGRARLRLAERPAELGSPGEFRRQGLVEHLDRGADMALTYLAERGHRNIGLMTGPMALPRAQGLLAGTRKAAARLGLNLDPRWMVESSYAFGDARDKARAMLEQAARPTAMFTFGTQFSFGVLQAAYQLGIDVPGDLSVLSYVECKQTEYCAPRMTTVSPSHPPDRRTRCRSYPRAGGGRRRTGGHVARRRTDRARQRADAEHAVAIRSGGHSPPIQSRSARRLRYLP